MAFLKIFARCKINNSIYNHRVSEEKVNYNKDNPKSLKSSAILLGERLRNACGIEND